MRIPLTITLALCVAIGAAGFFFGRSQSSATVDPISHSGSDAGDAQPDELPVETNEPATKPEADKGLDSELVIARTRIADLEAGLNKAQGRADELQAKLDEVQGAKVVLAADVLAKLELFRKNGLSALMQPGATGDIVRDLKELGEEGVRMVLDLLGSESKDDRFLAAKLLEDMADPASIPDLKKVAMEDTETMVANMASHAIALMNSPLGAEALHDIVAGSPHIGAQVNSMFGLCSIGDDRGIEITLAYMTDDKNPKRLQMALGTGILILDTPKVLSIVNHISSQVRGEAEVMGMVVSYYQRIGTAAARTELQNLLNDPSLPAAVREQVLGALN